MAKRRAKTEVLLLCFAVVASVARTPPQLPPALLTDAGASAMRFTGTDAARRQFVDHYARGAIDALIWGAEISDSLKMSLETCATGGDAQLLTIECGYAEGAVAISTGRVSATFEDFGYERATIVARVVSDAGSQHRFVATQNGERWLLAPSPGEGRLAVRACYRLGGFLGPRSALDARHDSYSREFIAVDATLSNDCGSGQGVPSG